MSSADLAAAAAFTAAGLSLVNVAITVHATRRGNRELWRRDLERPIVARCLTISYEARVEWLAVSQAVQEMGEGDDWSGSRAEEHALKGRGSLHDLIDEVGQLNLLASDAVREVAVRLVVAHTKERRRVIGGHQADQDDLYSALEDTASITELEAALIEKTRADLGLAPGFQVPPNSLLARLLGRDQGQRRPADGS